MFQRSECSLQSLALSGCNMDAHGLRLLTEGLAANTSLHALNLNNNEVRPEPCVALLGDSAKLVWLSECAL